MNKFSNIACGFVLGVASTVAVVFTLKNKDKISNLVIGDNKKSKEMSEGQKKLIETLDQFNIKCNENTSTINIDDDPDKCDATDLNNQKEQHVNPTKVFHGENECELFEKPRHHHCSESETNDSDTQQKSRFENASISDLDNAIDKVSDIVADMASEMFSDESIEDAIKTLAREGNDPYIPNIDDEIDTKPKLSNK